MNMDHSLTTIERKTYSLLDWVGDIGGLFDGLRLICLVIVWPVAAFTVRAEVLSSLFQFRMS